MVRSTRMPSSLKTNTPGPVPRSRSQEKGSRNNEYSHRTTAKRHVPSMIRNAAFNDHGFGILIISIQSREPDSEQPVIDDITFVSLVQKIVVDQILQGGTNSRMRPESVTRHEVTGGRSCDATFRSNGLQQSTRRTSPVPDSHTLFRTAWMYHVMPSNLS